MQTGVYRQSSGVSPDSAKADPENRLLGRFPLQRLDFERLRDALLAASGKLDGTVGGKSVDIFKEPFPPRRTLYMHIDRQNLPGTLRAFDFASPDTHSPQRFTTTVPQQALFLMNGPFVVQQAQALALRTEGGSADPAKRVEALYRLALGRAPKQDEIELALAFVRTPAEPVAPPVKSAWQYGYGPFDEKAGKVAKFTPLPHFTGQAYQGGGALPDPKLGWCLLNAQGGHPDAAERSAVRRWVAPHDGTVSIAGTLHHPADRGDGVRARVSSSRTGLAGTWTAQKSKVETPVAKLTVKAGDAIDFVVDSRGGIDSDGFAWVPVVTLDTGKERLVSDAGRDFAGPDAAKPAAGLSAWEQLAQVLLLSNEFAFVD